MILRDYQEEAVRRLKEATDADGSALLVAATGAGKTVMLAEFIRQVVEENNNARVLFVQHRDELLAQNKATVDKYTGLISSVVNGSRKDYSGQVIFAMSQTISREGNLIKLPPCSHVVYDEAHHAGSPGGMRILNRFEDARKLGATATPHRADGRGLGPIFGGLRRPTYYVSTARMIAEGILVPPVCRSNELQGSETIAYNPDADDFSDSQEAASILNCDNNNRQVISEYKQHARGRRSIAFCCNIAHAVELARAFRAEGISAQPITADTSDSERSRIFKAFDRGEIEVVTNCMVLTEGFDNQPVSCIMILRPMNHKSTFIQAAGRGLRRVDATRYPGIIKRDCRILDFSGTARRHGDLEALLKLEDTYSEGSGEGRDSSAHEQKDPLPVFLNLKPHDIRSKSPFAWETFENDEDSIALQVACSIDHLVVVVRAKDSYVALAKQKNTSMVCLYQGDEVIALSAADDYMRQHETKSNMRKGAGWQKEPATEKQYNSLRGRLTYPPKKITKYGASCLIGALSNWEKINSAIARYAA